MSNLKKRILYLAAAICVASALVIGILTIVSQQRQIEQSNNKIKQNAQQYARLERQYKDINAKYTQAKADKATTQSQLDEIAKQKADIEAQLREKEAQLQSRIKAKNEANKIASAAASLGTQKVSAEAVDYAPATPVAGCGDNMYANYIYMHESGCRTHNPNGSGCDGIGQACPSSKVIDVCGYDYTCQNAWFTEYANKYGGWAGAYQFWLNNHWW